MTNLPDEMKIACCKTCLLASAMRDCKTCPFRVGLVYRQLEQLKRATELTKLDETRMNNLKSLILA